MKEPNLELEIVDNSKAILVVECPDCGDKSNFLLDGVSPGTSVLCNCGGVLDLTDNNLKSIEQKFNELNKNNP